MSMIFFPPIKFDVNEWFFLFALLTWVPLFFLPKHFSPVSFVTIWVFNYCLGQTADYSIAFKPFDLYDINDRPELEYFDFLLYFCTYPPIAFYMLYIYDSWKPKKWKLSFLILAFAVVSMLLEWTSVKWLHVFTYKGWTILYSGFVYLVVYSLNIAVIRFLRKHLPRTVR